MKISNNTLSVILVMIMVASVFGTFISLSYVSDNSLTGFATSNVTGTTSVTVASETSCSATDSTISFGTLARGANNDSETLSDYITIENDGNAILNISAYATENLWDVTANQAPNTNWQIRCNAAEAGSCNTTYANIPVTETGNILVTGLTPSDAADVLTVAVNITVPNDETAGAKSGTIKFVCLSSG